MGRHSDDVPIELAPGQEPYGAEGPPARLRAGYLRRRDPDAVYEDLGERIRSAWDLTGWEQAFIAIPWLALVTGLVLTVPDEKWHQRAVRVGLALLAHGPLYWAADRYAMTHAPWRGPRWLRRRHPTP